MYLKVIKNYQQSVRDNIDDCRQLIARRYKVRQVLAGTAIALTLAGMSVFLCKKNKDKCEEYKKKAAAHLNSAVSKVKTGFQSVRKKTSGAAAKVRNVFLSKKQKAKEAKEAKTRSLRKSGVEKARNKFKFLAKRGKKRKELSEGRYFNAIRGAVSDPQVNAAIKAEEADNKTGGRRRRRSRRSKRSKQRRRSRRR